MAGEKLFEYLGNITHFDGWSNIITGLGMKNRDKKKSTKIDFDVYSAEDLECIYSMSDIAENIIDILPEDMMTKGHTISLGEDEEKEASATEALNDFKKIYNLDKKITEAMKMARLYGDSYLILGWDDGQEPDQPLNEDGIKSLKYAHVFTSHDMTYKDIENDPNSLEYRKPKTYQIYSTALVNNGQATKDIGGSQVIHVSRMVHFVGKELPFNMYRKLGYRNLSVLNKSIPHIKSYDQSYSAAATFMEEFTQGIFKIKDLGKLLAAGKDNEIMKRLELVDMKRSVVKSIVIDADGEDFTRQVPTLAGVPQVMEKMEERVVTSSNMPHTKLLGQGATGTLGGGGESENKEWYDFVSRKQKDYLVPKLNKLYELIMKNKSGPFRGVVLDSWEISFNSLWEMSALQKAELHNKQADADKKYIESQVLSPEEVAISRFSSREYKLETNLLFDRETDGLEDDEI